MGAPRDLGAIGSGGAFAGFAEADFNAYEPKKWSSNVFTLERRKAKDKLLALARAVLAELEGELKGLELGASDESPTVSNARKVEAQWVFFTRNAEDRTSIRKVLQRTDLMQGAGLFDIAVQHQHACISLRLDQRGLAMGIEIATKARVDRDNAAEKLKNGWAREKLTELAHGLPNGCVFVFAGQRIDAVSLKPQDLETWIPAFAESDSPFVVEALLPSSEEILRVPELIGTVTEHIEAFIPLFRFLAWAHDNEHRPVKEAQQKLLAEQKKKAPAFGPGDRVTILSGLFAGRSGYLSEIDPKGRAKVMVGPVSVAVDAKDLKSA